ncbi:hypothetical protein, partial [Kineosporia sp. A_224]|uniref:hypothetical protein n=1 Tax=Kineosporia sp. A_224 TaxID=1962180 RepID=UPI001E63949A
DGDDDAEQRQGQQHGRSVDDERVQGQTHGSTDLSGRNEQGPFGPGVRSLSLRCEPVLRPG